MSGDLNELFKLVSDAKKNSPVSKQTKEIKENIQGGLSDLFSEMARLKANDPVAQKNKKIEEQVRESVETDLHSLFSELASLNKQKEEIIQEQIKEEHKVLTEVVPLPTPIGEVPPSQQVVPTLPLAGLDKWLATPKTTVDNTSENDLSLINKKIKFLEQWIGKIQNAGPGSGEVNLRYLDDVARETIADGRWLKYDAASKKFVFDEINPFEVVENTTEVTTSTYTVTSTDFYIGVNYAGPVTITLPATANSGRMLIIKDEDGDAETNPITVLGTVDNDAGGFIIQINNGAIQLLYRNGWRIV